MGIVKRLSSIFGFKKSRTIRASFDVAKTTTDNSRHWSAADSLSADAEASSDVRKTIRDRARYEVGNNSYASGLVQILANDTIGSGPRLQMLDISDELSDRIEGDFRRWAEEQKLAQKLWVMRVARCRDGESFAVIGNNPKMANPVKMKIDVIEADRVEGDAFGTNEEGSVDGIKYDAYGNPVSYRILKQHPGGDSFGSGDAENVSAENVLHAYRPMRPELHRGVSELASALPLFAQLRRYTLAVLSAAEAAADFSAILYTDAPPDGDTESLQPLDTIPLERNMMMTMPAGWKMGQLDTKHPSSNYGEAVKCFLAEIARSVCGTYGTISGDYSGFNYASGRLDNQIYQKSIIVDRKRWEEDVLNPLFDRWIREWCLVNGVTLDEENMPSHEWFWDGFLHVDPTKEANADAINLANHTTSYASVYSKQGKDWRTEFMQIAKEKALMKKLGISEEDLNKKASKQEEEDDE